MGIICLLTPKPIKPKPVIQSTFYNINQQILTFEKIEQENIFTVCLKSS